MKLEVVTPGTYGVKTLFISLMTWRSWPFWQAKWGDPRTGTWASQFNLRPATGLLSNQAVSWQSGGR